MPSGDEVAEFPRAADLARGRVTRDSSIAFRPYWWDGAPRRDAAASELPRETDVAIVGSGFTGLCAALTLLRRGRHAVVLERDVPGYGASTRNGGQIGTGNQKLKVDKLAGQGGGEKSVELLREGMRILEHIEHVIASERIDCHFRRCGRFRGAMRPEHYETMARDMEALRKAVGLESFMVPRAEQHREVGSDLFFGGMVMPNDASLHPGLYHAGLMQRIEEAGGRIVGRAGVTAIARRGSGFRLSTAAGEIRSRDVIVATDGYTDGLVPELRRRIVPIGSAIIATAPLGEVLFTRLLPKNRVYGNTYRVFSYFRGAPAERRILWGGRVSRTLSGASPKAFSHLARDMLRFFPELAAVPVTHAWDGLIGQTMDGMPHIGRSKDGAYFALGYCGNAGVSRGTYFGHKVALKLLGDPEGDTAFDDLAFPSFPVQPIAKLLVPVVETWYRLRDRHNY
jgi:glycine/D-amino acid oxidase-like deaminating enzyme